MSTLLQRAYSRKDLSHDKKLELTIAARNVELNSCKKKINALERELAAAHAEGENIHAKMRELDAALIAALKAKESAQATLALAAENEAGLNELLSDALKAKEAAKKLKSHILTGIRLVLERDDMVVGPRTHVLKQMARLRGLAGWLEERGATSNAKMAREILEYFEDIFHDRAMTAQLLKELE